MWGRWNDVFLKIWKMFVSFYLFIAWQHPIMMALFQIVLSQKINIRLILTDKMKPFFSFNFLPERKNIIRSQQATHQEEFSSQFKRLGLKIWIVNIFWHGKSFTFVPLTTSGSQDRRLLQQVEVFFFFFYLWSLSSRRERALPCKRAHVTISPKAEVDGVFEICIRCVSLWSASLHAPLVRFCWIFNLCHLFETLLKPIFRHWSTNSWLRSPLCFEKNSDRNVVHFFLSFSSVFNLMTSSNLSRSFNETSDFWGFRGCGCDASGFQPIQ